MTPCESNVRQSVPDLSAEDAVLVLRLCQDGWPPAVIAVVVRRRHAAPASFEWARAQTDLERWLDTLGDVQQALWRGKLAMLDAMPDPPELAPVNGGEAGEDGDAEVPAIPGQS